MPRKPHARPTKRHYASKTKHKNSSRVTNVVRSVGPIAPRSIVRMKYSEMWTSSNLSLDKIYNLNSVNAPSRSGATHQPYGHDTYAALYNRYRVFALHYRVSCTGAFLGRLCVQPSNDVSFLTNMSLVQESPGAISKEFTSLRPAVISGKINCARVNGSLASVYKSDDRFQAVVNNDPTELMGLHICTSDAAGLAVSNAYVNVTLVYWVEFFDPKPIAQS